MMFIRIALCAIALAFAGAAHAQTPCRNGDTQIIPCTGMMQLDGDGKLVQGAAKSINGTFSAAGTTSASLALRGAFTLNMRGTGAIVVVLERSYDAGATWFLADRISIADASGDPTKVFVEAYNSALGYSATYTEPEASVLYRLRVESWTSGATAYRLSQ